MKSFSSLPTAILAATAVLLSAGAQAGPMPTNVAAMNSMVDKGATEVRYRGGGFGYRGGLGYRGGFGYRGGLGYRGYGVAAGAIVGGAIARSAYYGGYGGYSDGYYGDPSYSYEAEPHYSYGGSYGGYSGGCTCSPYGGYVAAHHYGW